MCRRASAPSAFSAVKLQFGFTESLKEESFFRDQLALEAVRGLSPGDSFFFLFGDELEASGRFDGQQNPARSQLQRPAWAGQRVSLRISRS
jgi:hypothetical protein